MLLATILIVVVIGGGIGVRAATGAHAAGAKTQCGGWSIVSSPNPTGILHVLNGVAAVTPNNVWAVGDYYSTSQSAYVSLIEHWTGANWQVVPSPSENYITNLNGITAISANDIWAVGSTEPANSATGFTLIEHWDGTSWSIVPSPSPGQELNRLWAVSAGPSNDVWAVGDYSTKNGRAFRTLIEHWDGTSWSVVPSPSPANFDTLYSVSVVKHTDQVWAVGDFVDSSDTNEVLIEHWKGSHWARVSAPNNGAGELFGVKAISPTNVWAVGGISGQTLTEQWNGTSWSVVPSPSIGSTDLLLGVVSVSANDVWAVGVASDGSSSETLTEQWNGTSWSIVTSPNVASDQLSAIAAVQKTGKLWSVGYSEQNKKTTLTEFYC